MYCGPAPTPDSSDVKVWRPATFCVNCEHHRQTNSEPGYDDRCAAVELEPVTLSPVTGKIELPVLGLCRDINTTADCVSYKEKRKRSWWFW